MPSDDGTDVISLLITVPFKLNVEDLRVSILQKGRPKAVIKNVLGKDENLPSLASWYEIYTWLCGSSQFNKLFCWPCLLMRPETSSWCSTGVDDFKKFVNLATKHNSSKVHSKAICEYDAALIEIGLPSEFNKKFEVGMEFKNEKPESDSESPSRISHTSKPTGNTKAANPVSRQTLTFQSWQTSKQQNEDVKLARRKRRLARLEIANAELISKKLHLEIELLEKKVEFQKILIQQVTTKTGGNDPQTI